MSNFNKVVTNIPVSLTETEMSNLSQTLSGIIQGGGGGGEGKRYIGDGVYVTVNNDANPGIIALTQTSLEKLNKEIPSAVSSFPDSTQYAKKTYVDNTFQTKDAMSAYWTSAETTDVFAEEVSTLEYLIGLKEDKLKFAYDNDKISAINGSALAGQGGVTGDYYSASNPSGFINSTQAETQILEKHYLTEASGNARYIPIPEGLSDGQYYAYTTSSWKVIQGAGDVSGISTVAHDDTLTGNGNNENLGVDTTKIQTKLTEIQIQNITDVTTLKTASSTWDNVSSKLNTTDFNTYTGTTAPSTYQEKGNYLSSNALEGYATTALLDTISSKIENDIPSIAGLATETDLQNVSAGVDYVSGALTGYQITGDYIVTGDILTATNNKLTGIKIGNTDYTIPTTDLTNYYTKSETSGATELSTEFAKYLTKTQYNTDSATFALKSDLNGLVNSASVTTNDNYVMTNTGWKVLTLPGGGMTQVIHDETLTGQGNDANSKLGVVWSALSGNTIYSAKSAESATSAYKAVSASAAKRLQDSTEGPIIQVGDITALQNWASSNSSTWDGVSAKLGTAQYALDSATFVTKPDTTQTVLNNNYLIYSTLTDPTATTGWMPLSANYYSKTEADGRYQKKEDMDDYLTIAKYATDSATFYPTSNPDGYLTKTIADTYYQPTGYYATSAGLTAGNQYAMTTTGWSDIGLSAYLPTSGGTVSGQLVVSGGSTFDSENLKFIRTGQNGYGRIGLASNGALAVKVDDSNSNTTQINVAANASYNELIQVQHGGTTAYLIPAVTATTTAGLTNDGILHIILES